MNANKASLIKLIDDAHGKNSFRRELDDADMRTGKIVNLLTPADMKIHIQHIASVTVVAALLAGCVTESAPPRQLSRIALITSGDTYFYGATRFGPEISVVQIDGKPVDKPYGPLELEPGAHAVTMKCGDSIATRTVTVAAGDIYQFAMVATPGVRGCAGSLSRVRSGKLAAVRRNK